jgi:ABC-2 type transport system permease protein
VRLYWKYSAISIRGQMQYRLSFVMQTLANLLVTGVEFLGIIALFARFGRLRDWTLSEVALFYGLVNVAFGLADMFSRGFDSFDGMIRRGEFDRLLLRPRSTALQVGAQHFVLKRLGRLAQGAAVLAYAVVALEVQWTAGKALLTAWAVLGSACLFYGLVVMQATVAFWTVETLELANILTYGGVETVQYPLSIYREWVRKFFTYVVPLACVNYYPVLAILGRPGSGAWEDVLRCASPTVGVVFLALSLQVWKFGVRHYRSTGS